MVNLEIERKLIIKLPDDELLRSRPEYTESKIEQIYIEDKDHSHRVRKREYSDGSVAYTETFKRRLGVMSAEEHEQVITEAEYASKSLYIEKGTKPVIKVRKTFAYKGHTFEVDIYPEWTHTCIMEVELESRDEKVEFPDFIEIIREVTGERSYSNHAMSRSFPSEEILG